MGERPGATADRERSYAERMSAALEIDPARTAVLTIDLQRDYLDHSVASAPLASHDAERVLRATTRLLDAARRADIPVVHAYATRRPQEVETGMAAGGIAYIREGAALGLSQNRQAGPRAIPDRVIGSPQAEVAPELVADTDLHVSTKKTLDSFQYSDLEMVLDRLLRPSTLLVAGVNTDTCVHSTVFSAANRGYRPVVVEECVGSMRGHDRHEMALELMGGSIAWVVGLDTALDRIRAGSQTRASA